MRSGYRARDAGRRRPGARPSDRGAGAFGMHGDARIDTIFLLSPTTNRCPVETAAQLGRGFLYGISRLGVTGARDTVADGAEALRPECARQRVSHCTGLWHFVPRARAGGRSVRRCRRRRQCAGECHRRGAAPSGSHRAGRIIRSLVERWTGIDMTIDELRRRIDQLDERRVELLSERARCTLEMGKISRRRPGSVSTDREAQVLHHVRTHGQHKGVSRRGRHRACVERIIDEARRIERATALTQR